MWLTCPRLHLAEGEEIAGTKTRGVAHDGEARRRLLTSGAREVDLERRHHIANETAAIEATLGELPPRTYFVPTCARATETSESRTLCTEALQAANGFAASIGSGFACSCACAPADPAHANTNAHPERDRKT